MSNITDALPISKKDLKDFLGYYDWSNNITLRARTGGSESSTYATIEYTSKDEDVGVVIPSYGNSAAITVGRPIKNGSTNVIVGGTSDYTRKLTAHIRGAFRVADGANTISLNKTGSATWTKIYVGGKEHLAAVMVDVFPGDSILIIAGDSIESSADPHIVQFIPWKNM